MWHVAFRALSSQTETRENESQLPEQQATNISTRATRETTAHFPRTNHGLVHGQLQASHAPGKCGWRFSRWRWLALRVMKVFIKAHGKFPWLAGDG